MSGHIETERENVILIVTQCRYIQRLYSKESEHNIHSRFDRTPFS